MDPNKESVEKCLMNFFEFGNKFSEVVLPIIDSAVKMSQQEPVSAYSVYKAGKDLAGKKKNSRNFENKSSKSNSNANKVSPSMGKQCNDVSSKYKSNSSNKKKSKKRKNKSNATHSNNFNSPAGKACVGNSKILSKAAQKRKRDLEPNLEHLSDVDAAFVESFDKGSPKQLDDFFKFLKEHNIDSSILNSENNLESSSSSSFNDDNIQTAAFSSHPIKKKEHKKRKAHSGSSSINTISRAKKFKKTENLKQVLVAEGLDQDQSSNFTIGKPSVPNLKLEPFSSPTSVVKLNSIEEGKRVFKWLLNPVNVDKFFAKSWETKACFIKREVSTYFDHLISFKAIDQMLLQNHVEFTKNIDVTSYTNGIRNTLNPEGRALPPVVWDYYGQGCSIRLLNPQTFLSPIFKLSTALQEYFQCLVGANAYLTPPNSQGFAPHYDDIEAFVLQIEGRKRWKLYKPRSSLEVLPRYSSKNFSQEEIGNPVLEEVLEPGDVLYFPRGTIHQAFTEPGYHSLHITLSVYQKQSYADLFEKMLPIMLQKAIASNVDLRKGLPLHAWQHAGLAFNRKNTKERDDFTGKVVQLMHKCIRDMPLEKIVDEAVDQMAKKFQQEALPPYVLPAEKLRTIFGSRSSTNERGECVCDYEIDECTNIRLLRANILRLVKEEDKMRIYYYVDNSKEYCQYETNFIEIEAYEAASVEILITSYPQYVGVSQLPLTYDENKISLATALWERGLLMMEKPFK